MQRQSEPASITTMAVKEYDRKGVLRINEEAAFFLSLFLLPERKVTTYQKVDVLIIRVPLELETELVTLPHPNLRFVRSCRNNIVAIMRRFDLVACFGEFKVLQKLNAGNLLVLLGCAGRLWAPV